MIIELVVGGISLAYGLNSIAVPFSNSIHYRTKYGKGPLRMDFLHSHNIGKANLPEDMHHNSESELALVYLNSAKQAVHEVTVYGSPVGTFNLNGQMNGNCVTFAEQTYGNYLYLLYIKDHPELKKYVRLSEGTVKRKDHHPLMRDGHMWVDFMNKGVWFPYETTPLGDVKSETETQNSLPLEIRLGLDHFDYYRTASFQEGDRNELKVDFNFRNILLGWHSGWIQQNTMRIVRAYKKKNR